MKGERPPQPHMAAIWDEAQRVGRTDVTDVIEDSINGLDMQARLFPDLFAHRITAALLEAGLLPELIPDVRTTRYTLNSGEPDFIPTNHVLQRERFVTAWVVTKDTERGVPADDSKDSV